MRSFTRDADGNEVTTEFYKTNLFANDFLSFFKPILPSKQFKPSLIVLYRLLITMIYKFVFTLFPSLENLEEFYLFAIILD